MNCEILFLGVYIDINVQKGRIVSLSKGNCNFLVADVTWVESNPEVMFINPYIQSDCLTCLTEHFFFFSTFFHIKLESLGFAGNEWENNRRFFFNLTSIPTEEFITSAELQVFSETYARLWKTIAVSITELIFMKL